MKIYEYNGSLYDEDAMEDYIRHNLHDMLVDRFGSGAGSLLDSLPYSVCDDIREWFLDDLSGHVNWADIGIMVRGVVTSKPE